MDSRSQWGGQWSGQPTYPTPSYNVWYATSPYEQQSFDQQGNNNPNWNGNIPYDVLKQYGYTDRPPQFDQQRAQMYFTSSQAKSRLGDKERKNHEKAARLVDSNLQELEKITAEEKAVKEREERKRRVHFMDVKNQQMMINDPNENNEEKCQKFYPTTEATSGNDDELNSESYSQIFSLQRIHGVEKTFQLCLTEYYDSVCISDKNMREKMCDLYIKKPSTLQENLGSIKSDIISITNLIRDAESTLASIDYIKNSITKIKKGVRPIMIGAEMIKNDDPILLKKGIIMMREGVDTTVVELREADALISKMPSRDDKLSKFIEAVRSQNLNISNNIADLAKMSEQKPIPFLSYEKYTRGEISDITSKDSAIMVQTLGNFWMEELLLRLSDDDFSEIDIKVIRARGNCSATFTKKQLEYISQVMDPIEVQRLYSSIVSEVVKLNSAFVKERVRMDRNDPIQVTFARDALYWWFEDAKKNETPPIDVSFAADFLLSHVADSLEQDSRQKIVYALVVGISPLIDGSSKKVDILSDHRLRNLDFHPLHKNMKISEWIMTVNHPERGITNIKQGPHFKKLPKVERIMTTKAIFDFIRNGGNTEELSKVKTLDELLQYIDFGSSITKTGLRVSDDRLIINLSKRYDWNPEEHIYPTLQRMFRRSRMYLNGPPSVRAHMIEYFKLITNHDRIYELFGRKKCKWMTIETNNDTLEPKAKDRVEAATIKVTAIQRIEMIGEKKMRKTQFALMEEYYKILTTKLLLSYMASNIWMNITIERSSKPFSRVGDTGQVFSLRTEEKTGENVGIFPFKTMEKRDKGIPVREDEDVVIKDGEEFLVKEAEFKFNWDTLSLILFNTIVTVKTDCDKDIVFGLGPKTMTASVKGKGRPSSQIDVRTRVPDDFYSNEIRIIMSNFESFSADETQIGGKLSAYIKDMLNACMVMRDEFNRLGITGGLVSQTGPSRDFLIRKLSEFIAAFFLSISKYKVDVPEIEFVSKVMAPIFGAIISIMDGKSNEFRTVGGDYSFEWWIYTLETNVHSIELIEDSIKKQRPTDPELFFEIFNQIFQNVADLFPRIDTQLVSQSYQLRPDAFELFCEVMDELYTFNKKKELEAQRYIIGGKEIVQDIFEREDGKYTDIFHLSPEGMSLAVRGSYNPPNLYEPIESFLKSMDEVCIQLYTQDAIGDQKWDEKFLHFIIVFMLAKEKEIIDSSISDINPDDAPISEETDPFGNPSLEVHLLEFSTFYQKQILNGYSTEKMVSDFVDVITGQNERTKKKNIVPGRKEMAFIAYATNIMLDKLIPEYAAEIDTLGEKDEKKNQYISKPKTLRYLKITVDRIFLGLSSMMAVIAQTDASSVVAIYNSIIYIISKVVKTYGRLYASGIMGVDPYDFSSKGNRDAYSVLATVLNFILQQISSGDTIGMERIFIIRKYDEFLKVVVSAGRGEDGSEIFLGELLSDAIVAGLNKQHQLIEKYLTILQEKLRKYDIFIKREEKKNEVVKKIGCDMFLSSKEVAEENPTFVDLERIIGRKNFDALSYIIEIPLSSELITILGAEKIKVKEKKKESSVSKGEAKKDADIIHATEDKKKAQIPRVKGSELKIESMKSSFLYYVIKTMIMIETPFVDSILRETNIDPSLYPARYPYFIQSNMIQIANIWAEMRPWLTLFEREESRFETYTAIGVPITHLIKSTQKNQNAFVLDGVWHMVYFSPAYLKEVMNNILKEAEDVEDRKKRKKVIELIQNAKKITLTEIEIHDADIGKNVNVPSNPYRQLIEKYRGKIPLLGLTEGEALSRNEKKPEQRTPLDPNESTMLSELDSAIRSRTK
jgi:hypothetical protein